MNSDNFACNGGLYFGLHFHGFGNEHRLTRLDGVTHFHQHINDVARHGSADVARLAGLLALANRAANKFVERLEHHLFRHAVDGQVEVTFTFCLDAHTGDVYAIAFAMHVDHEFSRYTFTARLGHATRLRDWQQDFRH